MKKVIPCLAVFLLLGLPYGWAEEDQFSRETQKQVVQEFQRHNYKKVIQIYKDLIAEDLHRPLPLVIRVLYSQSLADTGELDEAIEALQEILVRVGDDSLFLLGF